MKQYLLLLAGLMILAPYGQADAKAVKLGRGNAYSVAADANLNTGANDTQLKKGECETNEECPSDKKCMGYKCVDVCTQPTPRPGMTMARICGGSKCITDPDTPHAFKCVDSCYNVVCKSGYTTEVTSNGCCCVATSCPSGQRLENGKCVANCTGVICKSGFKAVSDANGCCCKTDTLACSSGQIYNTTIGKCVNAVCPLGCLDDCKQGCGSCESGRYLNYNDGLCPLCSSAIANCATCTSSKSGPTCTKCKSGYWLNGGKCESCPLHASCPDGVSFYCKSGYSASGGGCITCLTKYQVMAAVNNKVCGYESTGLSTDSKSACKQQVGTRFVCQSDYYYLQGLAQYKPYLSSIGGVNDKICDFCTSP